MILTFVISLPCRALKFANFQCVTQYRARQAVTSHLIHVNREFGTPVLILMQLKTLKGTAKDVVVDLLRLNTLKVPKLPFNPLEGTMSIPVIFTWVSHPGTFPFA